MESFLKCPVTALKIVGNHLFTGQGSKLIVYCLDTYKKIYTKNIFDESRIHKIRGNAENQLIFIGGKSLQYAEYHIEDGNLRLKFLTDGKVFKGWIWDATFISLYKILLISAHNTILIWDIEKNTDALVSSCNQQCILYCASMLTISSEVIVAVGTVFNQVLMWKPLKDASNLTHHFVDVWKRFVGHEGVIFGIQLHPNESQILSVSDDRSIRLWSIDNESCLQVLYGHTARVWDAKWLNGKIVSIGEDSVCLLWDHLGQIKKRYCGHKGKSIWSLDVNCNTIVTGGGDGGIRIWNIDEELVTTRGPALEMNIPSSESAADTDFPRTVKLLDHESLLLFTNMGVLWKYTTSNQKWNIIQTDPTFGSYCCMDVKNNLIVIGNLAGVIKVLALDSCTVLLEQQVFTGKIFNIVWLQFEPEKYLIISGPDGVIKLVKFSQNSSHEYQFITINDLELPYSRQRWLASAALINYSVNNSDDIFVVCGDRRGSLHLYNSTAKEPLHSLLGIHGKTGVTSIMYNDNQIYTTGRDGQYQIYQLNTSNKQLELIDKQKACKGMDWIEGLWFLMDDIVIYGFYLQSYFAAWSCKGSQLLFKIKCGGGYRSWDVRFPLYNINNLAYEKLLTFTYLKGTVVNFLSHNWKIECQGKVLQESLHGREVLCLKVIGKSQSKNSKPNWLVATCSEDTTVSFHLYKPKCKELEHIHTATGHIGGVKDICFVGKKQASLGNYFVSCGSRTSLKIWKIKSILLQKQYYGAANGEYVDEAPCNGHTASAEFEKVTSLFDVDSESINNSCRVTGIRNKDRLSLCGFKNGDSDTAACSNFSCSLLAEIYNPEMSLKKIKLKNQSYIDDMRYLSCSAFSLDEFIVNDNCDLEDCLCCICACSDGVARIYIYYHDVFTLLSSLDLHKHCVQVVRHSIRTLDSAGGQRRCIIFTTSTDGTIAVWDISEQLIQYYSALKTFKNGYRLEENGNTINSEDNLNEKGQQTITCYRNSNKFKFHDLTIPLFNNPLLCSQLAVHQSGINTLDILPTQNGYCLLSGGDDNCVCFSKITFNGKECRDERIQIFDAHVSSITAVKFISESLVVSASIDQRIKFWKMQDNKFKLAHQIFTKVADVSNMEIWMESIDLHVAITGIGVEIFTLQRSRLTSN